MVFYRYKNIKGTMYAYLVQNTWNKEKKQSRQKVIRYIGRIDNKEQYAPIDIPSIFKRDQYTCQYCGIKEDLCLDHKVSLHNGGINSEDNVQILCRRCKGIKGSKNHSVQLAEEVRKRSQELRANTYYVGKKTISLTIDGTLYTTLLRKRPSHISFDDFIQSLLQECTGMEGR